MKKLFILDFGSGNTCKNDNYIAMEMLEKLFQLLRERKDCDFLQEYEIIIKWQLFEMAGDNVPLAQTAFDDAFQYAESEGIRTTASVFDQNSLRFLLQYDIPFLKIANREDLWELVWFLEQAFKTVTGPILPIVKSGGTAPVWIRYPKNLLHYMVCVSKYPSEIRDYIELKKFPEMVKGLSDHTADWQLFRSYRPEIYECHYKLEDSTGLDAGPFARTPKQLTEIIK